MTAARMPCAGAADFTMFNSRLQNVVLRIYNQGLLCWLRLLQLPRECVLLCRVLAAADLLKSYAL